MSSKNFINELNSKLEAFKFFEEERLEMLMVGMKLQIALREAQDDAYYNPDLEDALKSAKQAYDTMYSKYELATIKISEFRNDCIAISNYALDLEKQLKATEEL